LKNNRRNHFFLTGERHFIADVLSQLEVDMSATTPDIT